MKKIFLSVLAIAIMTSFAFADNGKGKKAKGKKTAKIECCDKKKCPETASSCDKTSCPVPVPGCCVKKA